MEDQEGNLVPRAFYKEKKTLKCALVAMDDTACSLLAKNLVNKFS